MKRRKKGSYRKNIFVCTGIVILCTVVVFLAYRFYQQRTVTVPPEGEAPPGKVTEPALRPSVPEAEKLRGKNVAIIIDDIGRDMAVIDELLAMNVPITFAVLPHLRCSSEAAARVHHAGRDVLLHLPMEPHGYPEKDPGTGALFTTMCEREIREHLESDLDSVPYACGVNNHMGSRFMEDEERLKQVMQFLKGKNLFFLDSMTTGRSVGNRVARMIDIRHAARDIFIDNEQDYEKTLNILSAVAESTDRWDTLILIGHPYPSTVAALRKALPLLKEKGIEVVPLSRLVG